MSIRTKISIGFGLGLALGVALAGLASRSNAARAASTTASKSVSIPESRRTAIVTAAQRVSPAVVTVSVVQTRVVRTDPFGGMFHDEFFDRFFPPSEYRQRVSGLGSGVIVDDDGTVLTNEHVVRDAEKITVSLPDGRQFPAKLLGATATYDLAVLKVDAPGLPAAPLGDSDALVVGEWAIAIGNPFGYLLNDSQPTVTAGVVSATRRDIKSEATDSGMYKNMIQTDAAINPGNSGGPLVNGDGEVIGVNTFIFTRGGGSIGLGFAIPINLARRVLDEIRRYGRVRVAYPGMQVQQVDEALAARLGWKEAGGLVVTRVDANGPAGRAGLKVEDRIRSVNGQKIVTLEDAQRGIYGAGVGDDVTLGVERDGRTLTLRFTLAEAPGGPRP